LYQSQEAMPAQSTVAIPEDTTSPGVESIPEEGDVSMNPEALQDP
jgi:hypothetical protein